MEPPVACPVCGAYSLSQDGQASILLAVCDVLVLKALEKIGSRIVRAVRGRHDRMGGLPMHCAHTIWPVQDGDVIDRALAGAWDVVPRLMDGRGWEQATSAQITKMLDDYVHDLVATGTEHNMWDLQYRFTSRLGLPVYLHERHEVGA